MLIADLFDIVTVITGNGIGSRDSNMPYLGGGLQRSTREMVAIMRQRRT